MAQAQPERTETGSIADIETIYREHYSRFLRFAVANLGEVEAAWAQQLGLERFGQLRGLLLELNQLA